MTTGPGAYRACPVPVPTPIGVVLHRTCSVLARATIGPALCRIC
jgi:hypothetical protein